jgi:hypothetical protein
MTNVNIYERARETYNTAFKRAGHFLTLEKKRETKKNLQCRIHKCRDTALICTALIYKFHYNLLLYALHEKIAQIMRWGIHYQLNSSLKAHSKTIVPKRAYLV